MRAGRPAQQGEPRVDVAQLPGRVRLLLQGGVAHGVHVHRDGVRAVLAELRRLQVGELPARGNHAPAVRRGVAAAAPQPVAEAVAHRQREPGRGRRRAERANGAEPVAFLPRWVGGKLTWSITVPSRHHHC